MTRFAAQETFRFWEKRTFGDARFSPSASGYRTVRPELICLCARVVRSARQLKLRFRRHCSGFEVLRQHHAEFL